MDSIVYFEIGHKTRKPTSEFKKKKKRMLQPIAAAINRVLTGESSFFFFFFFFFELHLLSEVLID